MRFFKCVYDNEFIRMLILHAINLSAIDYNPYTCDHIPYIIDMTKWIT